MIISMTWLGRALEQTMQNHQRLLYYMRCFAAYAVTLPKGNDNWK